MATVGVQPAESGRQPPAVSCALQSRQQLGQLGSPVAAHETFVRSGTQVGRYLRARAGAAVGVWVRARAWTERAPLSSGARGAYSSGCTLSPELNVLIGQRLHDESHTMRVTTPRLTWITAVSPAASSKILLISGLLCGRQP